MPKSIEARQADSIIRLWTKNQDKARGSVINESLIFLSYHNIDLPYAFQLANLLIRYYRKIWLDRFEVSPTDDWRESAGLAYHRATGALAILSDDYLQSAYCRREYEQLRQRDIPIIAVIPRDFSTEKIADFAFEDWLDFRRWFDEQDKQSLENLLNLIPQSDAAQQTGERLGYLRGYIAETELRLAKHPLAWSSLRAQAQAQAGQAPQLVRPRAYPAEILQDWVFRLGAGDDPPLVEDILQWSAAEDQFLLQGDGGSGADFFARLLSLAHAHAALRDSQAPVPIWLDLLKWDEASPSLPAFLESEWQMISYWKHWLGSNRAIFYLHNWLDLLKRQPVYAAELKAWRTADSQHKFVLLSGAADAGDAQCPQLSPGAISMNLAMKLASACLSPQQAKRFGQSLRQQAPNLASEQLDYLSLGIELAAADMASLDKHWRRNPLPALIASRSKRMAATSGHIDARQLVSFLRKLAWNMMQLQTHQLIQRSDLDMQAPDQRLIDFSLAIGILEQSGDYLRFGSQLYQWYLAADHISKHSFQRYLTAPQFRPAGDRAPQKWDPLLHILVDNLADAEVQAVALAIAETDPFLASGCLRRRPGEYAAAQESLLNSLVQFAAGNAVARKAFRACVNDMPDTEKTAETLVGQLSRFDKPVQLWLCKEILALRLDLPIDFVELVACIDRDAPTPVIDAIADSSLWLAVAYLVKLTKNPDQHIQANAIWMLSQIKFLPTAVLLLDYLENGQGLPQDEIALALMNYAYSEILVSLLRWAQDNPEHSHLIIEALRARGRAVSSALLALAKEDSLALNPAFYETMVEQDEPDLAIGLAQLLGASADLPAVLKDAIARHQRAERMKSIMADAIQRLPDRDRFPQLLEDCARVLENPPESTVLAGSGLSALLYGDYGEQTWQGLDAQAELPAELAPPDDGIPDEIEIQLRHADWQWRRQALQGLAQYPPETALPHVLETTGDSEPLVRLTTYELLWRFSAQLTARKALVAALSDSDQALVDAVTELLTDCPDLALDELLELLDSENASAVAAAIAILQAGKYAPALDTLERLRRDQRRPREKEATIGQLAATAIAAISRNVPPTARPEAASDVLRGDQPDIRSQTGAAASQAFSDEEKILRTLSLLRDDDWGRSQKAAQFLRKFARHLRDKEHGAVLRLLCAATQDEHWQVRWAVCEALAWLPDPEAQRELTRRLGDANWMVQAAAVRALVAQRATAAVDKIMPLLGSPQQALREAAAEALGDLGDAKALRALAEALQTDADDFVRFAALKSLQQINPGLAREHLAQALGDDFIHARWYAVKTLAPVMGESDIPTLARLLGDDGKPAWEAESIRDIALAALQRINSPASHAAIAAAIEIAPSSDA